MSEATAIQPPYILTHKQYTAGCKYLLCQRQARGRFQPLSNCDRAAISNHIPFQTASIIHLTINMVRRRMKISAMPIRETLRLVLLATHSNVVSIELRESISPSASAPSSLIAFSLTLQPGIIPHHTTSLHTCYHGKGKKASRGEGDATCKSSTILIYSHKSINPNTYSEQTLRFYWYASESKNVLTPE
jgi:hypothetical protein